MSESDGASGESPLSAAGEPLPGPGALLLEARRAQGLSIGDVARQLKLSVRQVEALERDDYSAFPGPVFVRGFLRNYAKLLRLDEEDVLGLTQVPTSAAPPATVESEADQEPPQRSMRAGFLTGAVVLVVLLGLMYALRGGRNDAPARPGTPAATPAMPGLAVSPQHAESPPPGSGPVAALEAPQALSGTAAAPAPSVTPERAPAPEGPSAAPAAQPPSERVAAPAEAPRVETAAAGERREVRLAFQDESWVEIRNAAGEVIFSRLNEPGSERLVRGVPPLTVVIGNAHGVTLSYRGQPVDLGPHTKVDVARLTLD
jgi:cytoskeleton protein RodZ